MESICGKGAIHEHQIRYQDKGTLRERKHLHAALIA